MMAPLIFVEASDVCDVPPQAIVVVFDREGRLPDVDPRTCDALITTAASPPAPWAGIAPSRIGAQIAKVTRAVARAPIAATLLARVLRLTEHLPFDDALEVESLAYSSLLGGVEFTSWLAARKPTILESPIQKFIKHSSILRYGG